MRILEVKTSPNLHIELSNDGEPKNLLLLWEDHKYGQLLHCDTLNIGSNANFYSSVNKPLSFFEYGVKFRVIDLKSHDLILEHKIPVFGLIKEKKILYISQNNKTGYGYAARSSIYQLITNGYSVRWETEIPKGDVTQYVPTNEYERLVDDCRNNKFVDYDAVIIHYVPYDLEMIINHFSIDRSKKIYCMTVWETAKLPDSWVHNLNTYANVTIVPSEFNKEVFEQSGVKNTMVWPYTVFPFSKQKPNHKTISAKCSVIKNREFDNHDETIKDVLETKTVYYNISQYTNRKNIDQLVYTFCSKFTSNDSVCLLLKLHFRTFGKSEQEVIKYKIKSIVNEFKNPPCIILCLEDLTEDEIINLHRLGDVYFTLNRGEGFGLCSYTAKQHGNKVICGGYGAEKEFLTTTDVIIPYSLQKPFGMIGFHNWYDGEGQLWAVYDNQDVIDRLRYYTKKEA